MADFTGDDLSGSRFERVDLTDAEFRAADLSRARFRGVDLSGVVMRGVELVDVRIDGEIQNLLINGVDVAPLVNAELDRRDPDRARMRPTDSAGFREAWDIVERLWDGTVERARGLDAGLLHQSVDGEWSFIETLRHLVFATDAWVRRAILGDPSPWDPLDLPWDEMPDIPRIPRDREVRPSLDQVLALRRDRMATVGDRRRDRRVPRGSNRAGRGGRLATAGELPGPRVSADRPQRGVASPALRRTGPRRPGDRRRTAGVQIGVLTDRLLIGTTSRSTERHQAGASARDPRKRGCGDEGTRTPNPALQRRIWRSRWAER